MSKPDFDIMELYSKPASYKFSQEEIQFIKTRKPKHKFLVKYALYNKHSFKNKYVCYIIDSNPGSHRRSGVENYFNVICTRPLTDIEYEEIIQNFGTNHRRFLVFYYQYIEQLIIDDAKYELLLTPDLFIKTCISKGYSKPAPVSSIIHIF